MKEQHKEKIANDTINDASSRPSAALILHPSHTSDTQLQTISTNTALIPVDQTADNQIQPSMTPTSPTNSMDQQQL